MHSETDLFAKMNLKNGPGISRLLLACAIVFVGFGNLFAQDAQNGKSLFESHCTSCHAIDKKLIGPALKGTHAKYEEAWLISWIKNSTKMIQAGDPVAVKLFNDNNKVSMNSFEFLSNEEIKDIIAYVGEASEKAPETAGGGGQGTEQAQTPGTGGGTEESDSAMGWIIALIVLAFIIIIVQIFNVLKLVSDYTKIPFFNPNNTNAVLMMVFLIVGMAAAVWETVVHGSMTLRTPASLHGEKVDLMFDITLIITGVVFVITQILLFSYAYIYRAKEGRKAFFYAHNNRLEFIWTIIPAIALTVLVLNGFKMWDSITEKAPEDSHQLEVFAYQFGWKARYPGPDNKLGTPSFNLISGTNELGIGIKSEYETLRKEVEANVAELEKEYEFLHLNQNPTDKEWEVIEANAKKLKLAKGHLARLERMEGNEKIFNGAGQDDLYPTEIHIPVGEKVNFNFRARDVIHSAYMPYFRVQMNVVPGLPTNFWFVPTITTADMRQKLKADGKEWAKDFDYYLFCAKICGAAHFNMKIKVVVDSKADYEKWLAKQKPRFATEQNPVMQSQTETEETKEVAVNQK